MNDRSTLRLNGESDDKDIDAPQGFAAFAGGQFASGVAAGPGPRLPDINSAIETEFVPRLMLAHTVRRKASLLSVNAGGTSGLRKTDRDEFVALVLDGEDRECAAFVEKLLARGVSGDAILMDLLAGAARRLGEMWERDEQDLVVVTLGLCRLHQLLRERAWSDARSDGRSSGAKSGFARGFGRGAGGPKILLATICGDQHMFGLLLVAEMFRKAGWRVVIEGGAELDEVAEVVGRENFDVVGMSASCAFSTAEAAREIGELRAASKNRDLKVFVGGLVFSENPALVAALGADGWARDAKSAPALASNLLDAAANHC